MLSNAYTAWEIRSSVLTGRAETLIAAADDQDVPFSDAERDILRALARRLRLRAREVVERG